MLPDISGFTLCGEIRKEHHFPVLMLTAKAEDMDKITGLTIGADDYITKPLQPAGADGPGQKPSRALHPLATSGPTRPATAGTSLTSTAWSSTGPPTSVPSTTGSWASPPLSLTFSGCL